MNWNRRQLSQDESFGSFILDLMVKAANGELSKYARKEFTKRVLAKISKDYEELDENFGCRDALIVAVNSALADQVIDERRKGKVRISILDVNNTTFNKDDWKYLKAAELDLYNPLNCALGEDLIGWAREWMQKAGLPSKRIDKVITAIQNEVPVLFWQLVEQGPVRYKKFREYYDTHTSSADRELARYKLHLAKISGYYTQPMGLDGVENLALDDLYVEPDFWMHHSCWPESDRKKIQEDERLRVKRRANSEDVSNYALPCFIDDGNPAPAQMNLHRFLNAWVKGETALPGCPNNRLLLLLGQPGQGKSSCCKHLVHDLASSVERVYFVRLKETDIFKHTGNPLNYLNGYLFKTIFKENGGQPLEDRTGLLVLDGLDEATLNQQATSSNTVSLIKNMAQELRRGGPEGPFAKLRIILSSRTAMLSPDDLTYGYALTLHLTPFSMYQQVQWVNKLSPSVPSLHLTKDAIQKIHLTDEDNPVLELLEQPVILMLVATANLDLTAVDSRHDLYNKLFDELINRKLSADQGGIHPEMLKTADSQEKRKLFRRTIAEVALACFLDGRGCTTVEKTLYIIERLEAQDLFDINVSKSDKIEVALSKLMISFYLTVSGESSNQTLEFFHRTLMEYLAVEAIVEYLKEFSQKKRYGNEDHFLGLMFLLFGQPQWSDQMGMDLEYHMKALTIDERSRIESMLLAHAIHLIENEFMPRYHPDLVEIINWQKFDKNMYFETSWLEASCTSLLFYLSLLEFVSQRIYVNQKPTSSGKNELNNMLLKNENIEYFELFVQNIKVSVRTLMEFGLDSKYYLTYSLQHLRLDKIDLSQPTFHEANLQGIGLVDAMLQEAFMPYADLSYSKLTNITLQGSYATKSSFYESDLAGADLTNADLSSANLGSANLTRADLTDAYLRRASLKAAYLLGANLTVADLTEADLTDANLTEADLEGADLTCTNLTGAILTGANLVAANLTDAILKHANLLRTNLHETSFYDADLTGAIIIDIDLEIISQNDLEASKEEYTRILDFIMNRERPPSSAPASFKEHVAYWRKHHGLTPVPPESDA